MNWIIKQLDVDVDWPIQPLSKSTKSPYVRLYQFRTFTLTLWLDEYIIGGQPSVTSIMNDLHIVAENGVMQACAKPSLHVPTGVSADSSKDQDIPGNDWRTIKYRGAMYDVDRGLYHAMAVIQGSWPKRVFMGEMTLTGYQPFY